MVGFFVPPIQSTKIERVKRQLRQFFRSVWVELCIGLLVIVSVGITLVELLLEAEGGNVSTLMRLDGVNNIITYIFIIELSLRFFCTTPKSRFFREFWIDILALLPTFRVFRTWRALRLLRLFRVLRLLGVVSRLASHFPYVFRRGIVEYIVVCGLLVTTVLFATITIAGVEKPGSANLPPEDQFTLQNSFWFSVYSLFAGEPTPITPRTLGGKIISVFVMFMGLTIFAMFTGTVSAYMVERFRTEGRMVEIEDFENHIVICGWNGKTEIIIREYRASMATRKTPIVVITQLEVEAAGIPEDIRNDVVFIHDDFTRVVALERAGVIRADTCIILSDTTGGRSEQDADARTILASLTVEKISPEVYTCAEILNRSYGAHLEMGNVNDYVVSGEYSAYMLAQSAMSRGLMSVLGELLTCQRGNQFVRQKVDPTWVGKEYFELLVELKRSRNATLIAVHSQGKDAIVNPSEHTFGEEDEVVMIVAGDN